MKLYHPQFDFHFILPRFKLATQAHRTILLGLDFPKLPNEGQCETRGPCRSYPIIHQWEYYISD